MAQSFNLEKVFGPLLDDVVSFLDEMPPEDLDHSGVKGMKWGVRKSDDSNPSKRGVELTGLGPDKVVRKTKNGDEISLTKDPTPAMAKVLNKVIPNFGKRFNEQAYMTIRDKNGKKVGDCNVWKKDDNELYLNWLGVDKSERGKGYATQAMKAAEKYGKEAGFKKMTLEVPSNSPDASHIYTKLGFKVIGEKVVDPRDTVWGGLTQMEYTFDQNVKHSLSPELYAYLSHAGVKGMKWGRRKAPEAADPSTHGTAKTSNFKRNIKIVGGVAAGVAVIAGSAYAVNALNKRGNTSASDAASSPTAAAGKNLLDLAFSAGSNAAKSAATGAAVNAATNAANNAANNSLNLGTPSRNSSSPSGFTGGPSLGSLNNILANTPSVTLDPKTGMYKTG